MKVQFRDSFSQDLTKIKNEAMLKRIKRAIESVEKAQDFQTIPNLKKLRGGHTYYRIKVGEYRIGLSIENNLWTLIRCLDRKDIYRYFP